MGLRRKDYVMIGVDIGLEHYNDSDYDDNYSEYVSKHDKGKMAYVIGERYFIIGVVIECDDDYMGIPMVKIPLEGTSEYDEYKRLVRDHIREKFDLEVDPQVLVFTDWA